MDWIEVTIFTTTEGIMPVTDILENNGIEGYALEDAADFEDFLQDTEIYWDYVDENLKKELLTQETKIKIYLSSDKDGKKQYDIICHELEKLKDIDKDSLYGRLITKTSITKQEDWEWGWKQYFKPFEVGKRFIIKPSWETVENSNGRMVLEIDPASSFGTGTHETTQLCITALEKIVTGGEKLLDMGTGSGILAVAASMLGANAHTIVDIDENCLKCAKENAEKNNVDIKRAFCGDAIKDSGLVKRIGEGYNIITANIVADIIIGMSNMFYFMLKDNGILICSGILCERADEVKHSLCNCGFKICEQNSNNGWTAFIAKK